VLCNQCIFKTLLNGSNANVLFTHILEKDIYGTEFILDVGKMTRCFRNLVKCELILLCQSNYLFFFFAVNIISLAWVVRVIRK